MTKQELKQAVRLMVYDEPEIRMAIEAIIRRFLTSDHGRSPLKSE